MFRRFLELNLTSNVFIKAYVWVDLRRCSLDCSPTPPLFLLPLVLVRLPSTRRSTLFSFPFQLSATGTACPASPSLQWQRLFIASNSPRSDRPSCDADECSLSSPTRYRVVAWFF